LKRVLLVSAYSQFLERNAALLMRRGLQLFNAVTGEEALALHEEHEFDLIVSDFKLADMEGSRLCSLIRNREITQQVAIILACQDSKGHLETVEPCGASAIITKPIDPTLLLKMVGSFLDLQLIRSSRVEFRVNVLCKDQKLEFICLSRDVSNTGILIQTEQLIELGRRMTCQFTVPPSYPVEAEVIVIRSTREMDGSHLYGVRFIDIQMSAQRAIHNYVSSIITSSPNSNDIKICANSNH